MPPTFFLFLFPCFLFSLSPQVTQTEVCAEYADQMKELEEILAAGPAAMNISVEQLAKQVRLGSHAKQSRPGLALI